MKELLSEGRVVMTSLLAPPARTFPDEALTNCLITIARKTSSSETAIWEPKAPTDIRYDIAYVPPNNCAVMEFVRPGSLGTAYLNGCTAAVAAYRDRRDRVKAFLGHYDAENVRKTDEHGSSKLGGLITAFAGESAVKVCVAYSRIHNPPRANESYDAESFPIEAILRECEKLPLGSRVLFVPYETSNTLSNYAGVDPGHVLYVGRGGSDRMVFGWNGHDLEIGKSEIFDERRRAAALASAAADDYDSLMFDM